MAVNRIHILGATGSGTTTLAQALEREHGYKWLCTDHAFWSPTHIPFVSPRPREERIPLIAAALEENPKWALAGSLCGWGDVFIPKFELVVYLYTPAEIRKERIKKREYERYGERIREGGDMFDIHVDFVEWAMTYDTAGLDTRSAKLHESWLAQLPCPIVRLDGTRTSAQHLAELRRHL